MKSRRQRIHRSRRSQLRRRRSRRIQHRQRGGNGAVKEIMKQIQAFTESKGHPGIYYFMNDENIKKGYAMIIGPRFPIQSDEEKKNAKYPYEEGLFFFDVTFPDDYPARPPQIIFLNSTIDPQNIRIHPNLYQSGLGAATGKVCLSILGTWAGPGWQPTMTLESTLLTVQSILGPNPIQNEPGFERLAPTNPQTVSYNHVAQHKSIEFSYNVFKMVLADYMREKAARNAARAARPAAGGAGAASEENNNYVEFESKLPVFIQPFYDELKGHMWSSMQFYIQKKLDVMIDMHRADPPGIGKVQTVAEVHHHASILDYASLSDQIGAFRLTIPKELRQAAAIENSSVRAALAAGAGAAAASAAAGNIVTLGRGELRAAGVEEAGAVRKMTKEELAAEREALLQQVRTAGYNANANFVRNMNAVALKTYVKTLQPEADGNGGGGGGGGGGGFGSGYGNDNEYAYGNNEEFVENHGNNANLQALAQAADE